MQITRAGSQLPVGAPAEWFTGRVRIDPLSGATNRLVGRQHRHGASPTTAMTHIAIYEALGGSVVEWMEHVTDEPYLADVSAG
jgi:hypothetical protein